MTPPTPAPVVQNWAPKVDLLSAPITSRGKKQLTEKLKQATMFFTATAQAKFRQQQLVVCNKATLLTKLAE